GLYVLVWVLRIKLPSRRPALLEVATLNREIVLLRSDHGVLHRLPLPTTILLGVLVWVLGNEPLSDSERNEVEHFASDLVALVGLPLTPRVLRTRTPEGNSAVVVCRPLP